MSTHPSFWLCEKMDTGWPMFGSWSQASTITRVLQLANVDNALLLTSDKDFGELVFRQRLIHAGVILYRLAGLSADRKISIIVGALAQHGDQMQNAFSLITAGHVRIRPRRDV